MSHQRRCHSQLTITTNSPRSAPRVFNDSATSDGVPAITSSNIFVIRGILKPFSPREFAELRHQFKDTMRRFIQDDRIRTCGDFFKHGLPSLFVRRKAEEQEFGRIKSGDGECRSDGRRSGYGFDARIGRFALYKRHQATARVRYPGVPASDTNATRWPFSSISIALSAAARSIFSSQRTSGLEISYLARSLPVTRVSSQKMASAFLSVSSARSVISPILPMGVATIDKTPGVDMCATLMQCRDRIKEYTHCLENINGRGPTIGARDSHKIRALKKSRAYCNYQ